MPLAGVEPASIQLRLTCLEGRPDTAAKLVSCDKCGKSFHKLPNQIARTKHNFCSRSCFVAFNQTGRRSHNRPKELTCMKCRTIFTRNKSHHSKLFCANCYTAPNLKMMTLAQFHELPSVKGKHPSWINAHIRSLNRIWNSHLTTKPCAVPGCEYSLHVELCHRKSIQSFPKTALVGEVNHHNNVVQLCRNHHWEFDRGILHI